MKKMILLVLAFALFFSVSSFAAKKMVEIDDGAPEVNYDNMVTTNVWPWLASIYNVGYERMIGSSFSVRPRAFYVGFGSYGINFYGFGVDLFWHPLGKGISGWFVGPRYDAWLASSSGASGAMHWAGVMGGYNIVVGGGFTTQIGIGAQANLSSTVSYGSSSGDLTLLPGTMPCFDAAIGWAF